MLHLRTTRRVTRETRKQRGERRERNKKLVFQKVGSPILGTRKTVYVCDM